MTQQEIYKTAYQLVKTHKFYTIARYKDEVRKLDLKGDYTKIDKAISEIVKKQDKRKQSYNTSLREQLRSRLESKLAAKLELIYPYRTSNNVNTFAVKLADSLEFTHTTNVNYDLYAKSYGHPGYDHHFGLRIKPTQKFCVIAGLLTIINRNTNEVIWFEQGQGYNLKKVEGYLYKNYHEKKRKNDTYEKAIKRIKAKRNKAARELINKRLLSKPLSQLDLSKVWIKRLDSIKAGNCPAGTDQFITKIKNEVGEIGGIRADFLLELSNKFNSKSFVERTIKYAFVHQ